MTLFNKKAQTGAAFSPPQTPFSAPPGRRRAFLRRNAPPASLKRPEIFGENPWGARANPLPVNAIANTRALPLLILSKR